MTSAIIDHYAAQPALSDIIARKLQELGKDPANLTPQDFAGLDEFHIRGRQATLELATAMKLKRRERVLDIGSGLGGPARTIARAKGCRMTGIDLTPAFTEAAQAISGWLAEEETPVFKTGDATVMPFEDKSFDAAISLHTAMNIADKAKLYQEAARVLKPCGLLGIYDVLQGEGGEPHFPVPWASHPSLSHLITVRQLTTLLEQSGFTIQALIDSTQESDAWLHAAQERRRQENHGRGLTFALFLGQEFNSMMENLSLNLKQRRVRTVTCIARRSLS